MAAKIHMFKKSAIEAGSPGNYYLNPSDNLMKMSSEWSVVEHEDFLTLVIHHIGFGDRVNVLFNEEFINIEVEEENKEKAARFDHVDGMKNFTIELNLKFFKSEVELDPTLKISEGTARVYISKLKK